MLNNDKLLIMPILQVKEVSFTVTCQCQTTSIRGGTLISRWMYIFLYCHISQSRYNMLSVGMHVAHSTVIQVSLCVCVCVCVFNFLSFVSMNRILKLKDMKIHMPKCNYSVQQQSLNM